MLKTLLFCTLIISAFSSYNFNLDDVVNIQEGDIQLLYDLYLQYLAPSEITLSAERYFNFKADILEIVAHNNDPTNTWKMGVTQFTGMTMDELRGTALQDQKECFLTNAVTAKGLKNLPASKDWRDAGAISSVKDQGKCGSCWTFAATGAMEAHYAIQHGSKPLSLSQQQLVDCARGFDTFGCSGGLPSRAYEYVRHAGGIETEEDYPYTGKDETCKFDHSKVVVTVPYGSHNITSFDEQAILETVATIGPVSISYEATADFKNYHGGVYVGKTCRNGKSTLNHDVLIVGYGTDPESKLDYWIIKNSWSTKFGEAGYFRMQRGVNMCGIATCASYPRLNARM